MNNIYPFWIDSNGNYYLPDNKIVYQKNSEIKFNNWFSRLIFDLENVSISISTLRKSVVSDSRKEKWEREDQIELSRTMLHTIRTADAVYNKMKSDEKTVKIPAKFCSNFDATVKIRRKSRKWTEEEVKKLRSGISDYGEGSWSKIFTTLFFNSDRTQVDLKDKWRNISKINK